MIDVSKVTYTVIIITEKGEKLNVTSATDELGWEEGKNELAMKIHFRMYNAVHNGKRISSLVKLNQVVMIQAHWGSGSGTVAVGNIVECEWKTSKNSASYEVVAYDNLISFQKSSDSIYFSSGKKTRSILTDIFKSWGIKLSAYTGPDVAHKKIIYKNKKLGEIIREILDDAKKKGGKAAIVRSTNNKIEVIAKGSNKDVYRFESNNSSEASHKASVADIVTRVKIVSYAKKSDVPKVEATINGKTQYGVYQKIITHSKSDSLSEAKEEANRILEDEGDVKYTCKLVSPDVPCVRKGDKIYADVGTLNGYYLINAIQHNAKNGTMTMEVEKYKETSTNIAANSGTTGKKYKVGDIVHFKGGTHYVSSYPGAKGYRATAGKAKITIANGSGKAHPWHLIHQGSGSNVYGWVDSGTFE